MDRPENRPDAAERHPRGAREQRPPRRYRGWWLALLVLAAMLAINYVAGHAALSGPARVQIPYQPTFLKQVEAGRVSSISSQGGAIQGDLKQPLTYPPHDPSAQTSTHFSTLVPAFANTNKLSALLERENVTVNAKPIHNGPPTWESVLVGFGPAIVLIVLFVFVMRRVGQGGGGGLMGFGRSRARRADPKRVHDTFADVAGIDDAKEALTEIVGFLRDPRRYSRLGGRIPKGVLLSGQPGTGKTLLARAVAGEAGVPFLQISASEFVEMLVGVGASRVRDLFKTAKASAPAIVFIDELDAIGRTRGGGGNITGANDEREQTLNQILTEMDGFDPATGVIVMAATNRPEILDPALLRPGRFDRRVTVSPPDKEGRRKILEVHTRAMPLAAVDLDRLARQTPGMVGADLANLANEAALTAARRGRDELTRHDFGEALERIVLGAERKLVMSDEDRRRTAYHEAGHAIVGMLLPGADPVRKVSIIPRGESLGVTFAAPDADRFNYDEEYLLLKIRVALGGRVAEEVVLGGISTGAESDIRQLTQLGRSMVGRWGMSPAVGPVAVLAPDPPQPTGEASDELQRLVDREVRRIVEEAQRDVTELLSENRWRLDALAEALLVHETLDQDDAYRAAGLEYAPPDDGRQARTVQPGVVHAARRTS